MIFAEGFVYQTSWMFSWVFRLWPTSQTMGLTTNMASLTFQWLTRMKRNYRRSFKTRRKTVQAEEPHWALRTSQSGGLQSVHRIAAIPRNPNICTKPLNRKWVTWSHENFSCHLIIIFRMLPRETVSDRCLSKIMSYESLCVRNRRRICLTLNKILSRQSTIWNIAWTIERERCYVHG